MPKIPLEQGTQEWLAYRQCHIMATASSCIMGTNPFMSELQLWEEMLGLRTPPVLNAAMERGIRLEPEARQLACKLIGIDFEPCVYESDKYSWQGASLDGLSACKKYILEIKCPGIKTHEMALNDVIRDYYITQMQHQMAVIPDAENVFYFSYFPEHVEKYKIIEVMPDYEYIKTMIERQKQFWLKLCTLQPPDKPWKLKKLTKKELQEIT